MRDARSVRIIWRSGRNGMGKGLEVKDFRGLGGRSLRGSPWTGKCRGSASPGDREGAWLRSVSLDDDTVFSGNVFFDLVARCEMIMSFINRLWF